MELWLRDAPRHLQLPAFTIEASHQVPVRVQWINDLVDAGGDFLSHLLAVDPTVHWANPPGGETGRDMRPTFESTPGPYTGPVPITTHLHGGDTQDHSDGYAEAWYLPAARNILDGFATEGSRYEYFREKSPLGDSWGPGNAVFEYANDQRATTMWYHDHTLGITRLNVYAGPAGFYLLCGGSDDLPPDVLPGPAPKVGDGPGTRYYEIPVVIQDRSFNADGSLFYPDTRAFFDGFSGPYIPDSDVSPIWNPEFFANTMVVNGRTWPVLEVEPRRYRFHLLNGCNSRFLILRLAENPTTRPATTALPFWVIGADGGFLPAAVQLRQVVLGPAERADVIVDFTGLAVGTELYLVNLGPDEPFGNVTEPPEPFANPDTTGQVMKLTVVPLTSQDPITENPALNSIEVWEIYNFTVDAHPIHIHEVQFQVVNRQPIDGAARPPEPSESGDKDTVIAYPGEITRVKALFDRAGLFVWHCHIVEHEDNEMMRPYFIGPNPPTASGT